MRVDLLPTTPEGKISRVIEECGEVLQEIGKLQRYGPYPTDHRTGVEYDHWAAMTVELAQLNHAITQVLNLPAPVKETQ